jgi:hypothetical protein
MRCISCGEIIESYLQRRGSDLCRHCKHILDDTFDNDTHDTEISLEEWLDEHRDI